MDQTNQFFILHFEEIVLFLTCWLLGIVVYGVLLIISGAWRWTFRNNINTLLFSVLLGGEIVLMVFTGNIIWNNIKTDAKMDLGTHLRNDTSWVREKLEVYFIEGKDLVRVQPDGSGRTTIMTTPDNIREYHLSPDGHYLLVVTEQQLLEYDLKQNSSRVIDSLNIDIAHSLERKGVINGVAWSPDSQRYCYRISRWSSYSSSEHWYIRSVAQEEKTEISKIGYKIPELYWDAAGDYLYYSWFDTLDQSVHANGYLVKLFRVFPDGSKPQMISQFPFKEPTLPFENWEIHGVILAEPEGQLSFGRGEKGDIVWTSSRGTRLGIDKDDEMFFLKGRWWRRYLYKIGSVPPKEMVWDGRFQPGDLEVRNLRWLPSGRYVIMEHYRYGILILNPANGNIGVLASRVAHSPGWYPGDEN